MTRTSSPPRGNPGWAEAMAPQAPSRGEVDAVIAAFRGRRVAEVEKLSRRLTERFPRHPFGWKVLGAALKQLGRLEEALPAMQQATVLAPKDAEAFSNLGIVLLHLERLNEAEPPLRQALKLKPDYAQVHSNLGAVLLGLGRPVEAEASYRRTVEAVPDYAEAHANLATALLEQGRLAEAATSLRRAIALQPDYDLAHSALGSATRDRPAEVARAHRRAWSILPGSLPYAILANLVLPAIADSREAIAASREAYRRGIARLERHEPAALTRVEDLSFSSFYLAYQDADDRPIKEALARLFRAKIPNLAATAPHVGGWRPPAGDRRLRVGFLSQFFFQHTIGKLFRGFIEHLDRRRFEVTVIHAPRSRDDAFRREIDSLADHALVLPADLGAQQRAVADLTLDVLIYPDIGMTPASYFLAHARLAPVQVVSFGHPDTTGLDTVDYFLSGAAMEPEGADSHYGERLIRLSRMPIVTRRPAMPEPLKDRAALGLPEGKTLYGCPQSLFKLHPDFDPILSEIAAGDPNAIIVLLEGIEPSWSLRLRERWRGRHDRLLSRTIFLDPMPLGDFLALTAAIDVGLDPIHFGGGNTFYESMLFGAPVVTWPGRFMRGRIVAGAYRQMRIADPPVVERLEDYAPRALALGRDPERRRAIRVESIETARRHLYDDRRAVRELEGFLEAAVAAAADGTRLSEGWRPDA